MGTCPSRARRRPHTVTDREPVAPGTGRSPSWLATCLFRPADARRDALGGPSLTWSAKEGASTTVCAVRPDTGQETVTLDHQGHKDSPMCAFRLTGIPVVDG